METDFIRLNTVLMIPPDLAKSIISFSQLIGKDNKCDFILDGENYHPHITLYSPEYPKHNYNKVFSAIENIASKFNSIHCRISGFSSEQGHIGFEIEPTSQIKKLHEEVILTLNPLREGHIRKKYIDDYHMNFSDEKIENIQKYGYPNSMSLYHPHLTILRLKNEDEAEELKDILNWSQNDFIVTYLGIYEMGEHGTCKKLIKEFKLQN